MTRYTEGGLTFSGSFVSVYSVASTDNLLVNPAAGFIYGEDGNRYYLQAIGDTGTNLRVINADTAAVLATKTPAQLRADADAALLIPPSGHVSGSSPYIAAFVIPDTPYFVVIGTAASGTKTSKYASYYKITSGSALSVVGGYACRQDGLNVQFSPDEESASAMNGVGFIISQQSPGDAQAQLSYPIAVSYCGENRSTVMVLPSVNKILLDSPLTENITSPWFSRELKLADAGYGANIFYIDAAQQGSKNRSRGFFLPTATGAKFAQMFYKADIAEHVAGTASPSNTWLSGVASTYPAGLITAVDVRLTFDTSLFTWYSSFDSVTTSLNSVFRNKDFTSAFPFPDAEQTYAGGAGTAADDYYDNPSVYPSDPDDPTEPWFLFFPRIYREAGARDKLGVRIFEWDPQTEVATFLAFGKGQVYTMPTDVPSTTIPQHAAIVWDRATGDLTAIIRAEPSSQPQIIIAGLGTFEPVEAPADTSTTSETLLVRAWAFPLDGHEFYVLRLGEVATMIYDARTGQWSEWSTQGYTVWNADHGVADWNGYAVAGDLAEPFLWAVDAENDLDEDSKPITRYVTGIIPHRERSPLRLNELRLTASVGSPSEPNALVSLTYSDDQGQTYSAPVTLTLTDQDYSQVLSFRSLGRVVSPGRVVQVEDEGGLVRIDGMDAEIETP